LLLDGDNDGQALPDAQNVLICPQAVEFQLDRLRWICIKAGGGGKENAHERALQDGPGNSAGVPAAR
jgi:hypothetical protein